MWVTTPLGSTERTAQLLASKALATAFKFTGPWNGSTRSWTASWSVNDWSLVLLLGFGNTRIMLNSSVASFSVSDPGVGELRLATLSKLVQ